MREWPWKMLSDRGIKEAEREGMLKFDPKIKDIQRQPASIDLEFAEVVGRDFIHGSREDCLYTSDFDDLKYTLLPKCEPEAPWRL